MLNSLADVHDGLAKLLRGLAGGPADPFPPGPPVPVSPPDCDPCAAAGVPGFSTLYCEDGKTQILAPPNPITSSVVAVLTPTGYMWASWPP